MAENQKRFITSFDFSDITAALTRDFTGREWLFAEIDGWLAREEGPPILILTGEPGIGKSAVAARLTETRPVAAHHCCTARRADTLDPYLFARSLSAQLTELEGFTEAVLREADARVEVRQKVERNMGQVIGAIVNAPSAAAAFNRAVVAPLRAVAGRDGEEPLLIVVDGLDEALQFPGRENVVHLLAGAALPRGVRLLLTTRPETGVLEHFERAGAPVHRIDAGQEENMADARRYVRERVQASERLQGRLAESGVTAADFAARAAGAGAGNFLYLGWLLRAVEEGEQSPGAEAAFPAGLDGVYREFLRTRATGERQTWRSLYRPLLGALAAAEEALTAEQAARFSGLSAQDAADGLLDVGQFLDPAGRGEGRYQLYHQSLVDFLGSRERAGRFWIDLPAVHGQIADVYLEEVAPEWSPADGYGLRHLQAAGREQAVQELLLDYGWLRAKLEAVGVTGLLADFELLEERDESLQLLYEALRLSAHVLAQDPPQLASQLWGRLGERPEAALSALLARAAEGEEGVWLRPVRPTLDGPGGPLIRTLTGHASTINSLAIIPPDGHKVVSASDDTTLKTWDLKTGSELQTLEGHEGFVMAVAVTSDGHYAVSGSWDDTIRVWELDSAQEVRRLTGHTSNVTTLDITPDGRYVVSGSWDRTLRVWDLETGQEIRQLLGHSGAIHAVAVSPNGEYVVSGSSDRTVRLWDLASGREIHAFTTHQGTITAIAITPNSKYAVSGARDNILKLWNLNTREEIRSLSGHTWWIESVTITPDGTRIISGSRDLSLKIWNLETGDEIRSFRGHSWWVQAIVSTPDGLGAISGSGDKTIRVWNLASTVDARIDGDYLSAHTDRITTVACAPDSLTVITGSRDRSLKEWVLATAKLVGNIYDRISAVGVSHLILTQREGPYRSS